MARPDVFKLRARDLGDHRWPRRTTAARIVHDVLVTNSGLALVKTQVGGITHVTEVDTDPGRCRFEQPIIVRCAFDDGSVRLLAAEETARPFLEPLLEDRAVDPSRKAVEG